MKRYLPVIVLGITPILGIAVATIMAWQIHPSRANASPTNRAEAERHLDQMFEDASIRGRYMLWGGAAGGIVGVVGAFALHWKKTGRHEAAKPRKKQLKCNHCGASHPLSPEPTECSFCQADWSGSAVEA